MQALRNADASGTLMMQSCLAQIAQGDEGAGRKVRTIMVPGEDLYDGAANPPQEIKQASRIRPFKPIC